MDAIGTLIQDHNHVKRMFTEYAQLNDRAKSRRKVLADQICDALTIYARVEEEVFYPAVREFIADQDLVDAAVHDHAAARLLIDQIEDMEPGDYLYDEKLELLASIIEQHMRDEEDELFPKVRRTSLDMVLLANQMAALRDKAPVKPNQNGRTSRTGANVVSITQASRRQSQR